MAKNTTKIIVGILALVIVLAFFVKVTPRALIASAGTGEPSLFDNLSTTGGLQVGVPVGNLSLPTLGNGSIYAYGPAYFAQDIVEGGLCTATLTASSNVYNVTAAQISSCNFLSVVSASTTGSVTLQLPASSTVSYPSNAGDSTTLYVYAASSTANNVVITATTTAGFSVSSPIAIASTTAAGSTITAGNVGIIDITKFPNGNFNAIVTPSK